MSRAIPPLSRNPQGLYLRLRVKISQNGTNYLYEVLTRKKRKS